MLRGSVEGLTLREYRASKQQNQITTTNEAPSAYPTITDFRVRGLHIATVRRNLSELGQHGSGRDADVVKHRIAVVARRPAP